MSVPERVDVHAFLGVHVRVVELRRVVDGGFLGRFDGGARRDQVLDDQPCADQVADLVRHVHRHHGYKFVVLFDFDFVKVAAQGVAFFVATFRAVGFVLLSFIVELGFVYSSVLSLFWGGVVGVTLATESWIGVHRNIFV